MWTIFKVFIDSVTILLLFYVLVFWPPGMWDLSSPTRDRTRTPCTGRGSLNHWAAREVPTRHILFFLNENSFLLTMRSSKSHVQIISKSLRKKVVEDTFGGSSPCPPRSRYLRRPGARGFLSGPAGTCRWAEGWRVGTPGA